MKVFVYGHYDSRGGTVAIVCESKEQADEVYNEELFCWSETKSQLVGDNRQAAREVTVLLNPDLESPAEQDFLYEAELEGAPDGGEDRDLEDDGGEVWIQEGSIATREEALAEAARLRQDAEQRSSYMDDEGYAIWRAAMLEAAESCERGPWRDPGRPVRLRYVDAETAAPFTDVNEDGRKPGWEHPGWDDDAFSFVLMYR